MFNTIMKTYQSHEKSSLWWKLIHLMKIHSTFIALEKMHHFINLMETHHCVMLLLICGMKIDTFDKTKSVHQKFKTVMKFFILM